jgi:hypothetical protein
MHDSTVYKDLEIYKAPHNYFTDDQYLLGDCGYPLNIRLITPFRKPYKEKCEKEVFNYRLSKARVKVEHANGILKERFQVLKGFRNLIKKAKDFEHVNNIVECCIILHNILIIQGDEWVEESTPLTIENDSFDYSELDNKSMAEEKRTQLMMHVENFYRN